MRIAICYTKDEAITDMTELTLKLIIILIPGAICSIILEKLTIHKPLTPFKFIVNSIMLGAIVYLLIQVYYYIPYSIDSFKCKVGADLHVLKVWENMSDTKVIPYNEIILATFLAIFLGYFGAWIDRKKVIYNIAKRLGASLKYGDENLYTYFLNADEIEEVYIRDIPNNLTYHGVVVAYSETDEIKEIVLSDVTVYRYKDSVKLYDIDKVYLSRPKDDLIIENAKKLSDG